MGGEVPERLVWFPALPGTRSRVLRDDAEAGGPELLIQTDEELLTRAQGGDTAAVAVLFDHFSRLVLTIGMRILRDRGEAEDLVQEVFLRLFQKQNTFDANKGLARTWMFQFAYRRALDRRSYLARRRFYDTAESLPLANSQEEAEGFEERMTAWVTGGRLHAAFETLTEKQRTTLELFFFEHCDLQEVAQKTGESFDNTRNHYYRGLKQLRKTVASWTVRSEK
jgi:RNA polymerase sigma-70 factor (ECF subfamily)